MTEETRKHEVHASEILQFGITKLGLVFVALYKTGATRLHQQPVDKSPSKRNPIGLAGSLQSTGERFIHLIAPSIVTAVAQHQYIIYLNVLAIMPSRWECYSSKCDRTLQRHFDGCLFYTVIITASSR